MGKNPVVWLIVQVLVLIWIIYDLTAPGEAQNQIVVIMEYAALVGISLGLLTTVVGLIGQMKR
jgi:FtsH-binding integral membrane protein